MIEIMPKTGDSEKKRQVGVYLSDPMIKRIEGLTEKTGLTFGEVLRWAIQLGVGVIAEYDNKLQVNENLRRKSQLSGDLQSLLESPDGQAILSELIAKLQQQNADDSAK